MILPAAIINCYRLKASLITGIYPISSNRAVKKRSCFGS